MVWTRRHLPDCLQIFSSPGALYDFRKRQQVWIRLWNLRKHFAELLRDRVQCHAGLSDDFVETLSSQRFDLVQRVTAGELPNIISPTILKSRECLILQKATVDPEQ